VLSGDNDSAQGGSVQIKPGDDAHSGSVWIGLEIGVHICDSQSSQEEREHIFSALEEKEDGGSPSGGGYDLILLDGVLWLEIDSSLGHLTIILRRK
jgi:hypothetical protein